jgi:hypothetical protein
MSERRLRISAELALPLDIAGEAIGVLATRGAGKSYTSAVLVEELYAAGVQLVVLDPTGVYWGLRSSADGKSDGLAIVVLGGAHGDVPLEPTAGKLIADLIVDTGQSLILDLSDFETKGAQTRFVADLAERLYHRKARSRTALHLIIDEANEFAPQRPMRDEPRMLGAVERIVGKGRSRGIGTTLITQRSASLNKNVLDLVDTLLAMRVLGPRDRKAIEDWITVKQQRDELGVLESLPSLPTGTAWVWAPVRGILQKVAIRRIRTFDSYETPKPGVKRVEPSAAAPIDLSQLGEQIRATAERAEASDPKKLQARIRELERGADNLREANRKWEDLAKRAKAEQVIETIVERVEVPVLNGQVDELRDIVQELVGFGDRIANIGMGIVDAIKRASDTPQRGQEKQAPRGMPARPAGGRAQTAVATPAFLTTSRAPAPPQPYGEISLGAAERAFLGALAQFPDGLTQKQLSLLTGYSAKSGHFANVLGKLRGAGLVTRGQPIQATEKGRSHPQLADVEPVPAPGPNLVDYWYGRLGKAERAFLEAFVAVYPDSLEREDLAERTGYSSGSGHFANVLGRLRTLGLIDGWRASEDLVG